MNDTTTETAPQTSDVIESLTAAEMSIAERKSGLSVATLEDADYPKVDLLGALGWVYAKRSEPTLTFEQYMSTRTLTQITDELGMNDDDTANEPVQGAVFQDSAADTAATSSDF